jgi:hypothetical protein
MISIRVWNVESDRDAKVVKFLEDEFFKSRQLGHLAIRSAGRSALRKCHRKGAPVNDSLKKAIQHYLNQDDYIIFVTDAANLKLNNQRLVNELKHVVKDNDFAGKIYFTQDIQDSESSVNTEWQGLVSDFLIAVDSDHKQFRKEWDGTIARFHEAFADTPEEEVIRDFEEALTEVRRERT